MAQTRSVASKKTVRLGLVQFPVSMYSAVEAEEALKNLCDHDVNGVAHPPSTCRQGKLACAVCEREATTDDPFKKGREVSKGIFALVDLEDVAAAKTVDQVLKDSLLIKLHPVEQMGAVLPGGKVYVLQPEIMPEVYATFREAIRRHPELAYTTVWAVRTKPAMFRLVAFSDYIVLTELAWPADVREQAPMTAAPDAGLLAQLEMFLVQMIEDFDPASYVDTAAAAINEILAAATPVAGAGVPTAAAAAPTNVTDLMAALKAQVDAAGKPAKKATSRSKTKVA